MWFAIKNNKIILKGLRNSKDGIWDIPMSKTILQHNIVCSQAHTVVPPFFDGRECVKHPRNISYLLSRLVSTANKYLMPTVKFPRGCTQFQYKVGHIPIDILFQRCLQKCYFDSFSEKEFYKMYHRTEIELVVQQFSPSLASESRSISSRPPRNLSPAQSNSSWGSGMRKIGVRSVGNWPSGTGCTPLACLN